MAQIARQRHTHAYRKHARFFQRVRAKGGHIAAGKNARVGIRLQAPIDAHTAICIERQAGERKPGAAGCLGDPEHRIGVHLF